MVLLKGRDLFKISKVLSKLSCELLPKNNVKFWHVLFFATLKNNSDVLHSSQAVISLQ